VVHERVAVKARRVVVFLEKPGTAEEEEEEEREDGSATADPTPARMGARRYA